MKPMLEWYEELNQPYRILAIHNYDKHFSYCNEAGSLAEALSGGFCWTDSPERFEYWNNLHDELKSKPEPTLEQSLSDLTKTLEEMKEAIKQVRKAIRNESI